jgi:murein DD-endopeptidase MepM/ murein hydrolase activator NlpD
VQTFDGVRWLSQRFAIDWIKADAAGMSRGAGDPQDPASYYAYGQEVLAVADGRVVSVLDDRSDRPVPVPDPALDRENAAHITTGNHVILSIGSGRFPMYAHLQPGSIRVRVGDRVRRGQAIALLGNSGNSTEPHLHFHVAANDRPLEADGLPYVHDRFGLTARVGGDRAAAFTAPSGFTGRLTLDPFAGAPLHRDELPLICDVVDFGG